MYDFATCTSQIVVFGIDKNPQAVGKEADVVLECASYWRAEAGQKLYDERE
jgi:hypothetical protein